MSRDIDLGSFRGTLIRREARGGEAAARHLSEVTPLRARWIEILGN